MKSSLAHETTKVDPSQKSSFQKITNQIHKSESKQLAYLKHKCQSLTSTINFIKNQNQSLRNDKQNLLALNHEYVSNLNKYYQDRANHIQKVIFPQQVLSDQFKIQGKLKQFIKKHIQGFKKLECDHRNLVQHCLTMQKQLKNYKIIVDECARIKAQLIAVNHNDIKQLVQQIKLVSQRNMSLRTQNNKIIYESEMLKHDYDKISKQLSIVKRQNEVFRLEMNQNRGISNRLNQQNKQKICVYEKKLYEMNIKCNALQNQLRLDLEQSNKNGYSKQKYQIQAKQLEFKQIIEKKPLGDFNKVYMSTGHSISVDDKQKYTNSSSMYIQKQNNEKTRRRRSGKSILGGHKKSIL